MTPSEAEFIRQVVEPAMRNGHVDLFWSLMTDASRDRDWDKIRALQAINERVNGVVPTQCFVIPQKESLLARLAALFTRKDTK
jgi:hypothetical protein